MIPKKVLPLLIFAFYKEKSGDQQTLVYDTHEDMNFGLTRIPAVHRDCGTSSSSPGFLYSVGGLG